ncbi:MAG: alginate export family protein [Bacteroidales bacterium]|nr:alginate export family protein [Bacteroidales bacterium]
MKPYLRLTVLTMGLLVSVALSAQAQNPDTIASDDVHSFTIKADLMTRGEFRYGGMQEEEPDVVVKEYAAFCMERARLNLNYRYKFLTLRLAPQHAGVWGQQGGGSFRLYEGWARLQSHQGLFLQVGRQALNYDDQRILGSDDWTMTASSHDILKVGYEGHGHQLHLIAGFNQNGERLNGGTFYENGSQPYKTMQTLWYHYDIPKTDFGFSLLFLNVGMQAGDANSYHTKYQQFAGAFLKYHPMKLAFEGSFYYQFGKEEHGIPISAYMASAKASYEDENWGLTAGYDYLSGDPNFNVPAEGMLGLIRHETIRGFSQLFGSHHKFYGAMDFFYMQSYVYGFTPGLQNAFVAGRYNPIPQVELEAAYHYMAIATQIANHSPSLGHELELTASWNITPYIQLVGGYTFMYGTETMEFLKRSNPSRQLHWGWMQLRVNPELLNLQHINKKRH